MDWIHQSKDWVAEWFKKKKKTQLHAVSKRLNSEEKTNKSSKWRDGRWYSHQKAAKRKQV